MASHQEPSASASSASSAADRARHYFDELRWVMQIRNTLEEVVMEADARVPVTVFSVPKELMSTKPEAYVPQLFALGPYHHWDAELYEMERYKLATAKNTQSQLHCRDIEQVVQYFMKKEQKIRAHYHRYLEFNKETLAWMMAIDASFLLEFLRNYSDFEGKVFRKVPSMSHMVNSARIKLAYNSIVRDIVMLENQIPLFLVRKILCFQYSSDVDADTELSKMLLGFLKELCPFKVMDNISQIQGKQFAHLLQLLYYYIVARAKEMCKEDEIIDVPVTPNGEGGDADGEKAKDMRSFSCARKFFDSVWATASGLKILNVLITRPLKFLHVPWAIISKLPGVSIILTPIISTFFKGSGEESVKEEGAASKPPLVEEIMIPSVTELIKAGVKFSATKGDLTTIEFSAKKATLYIPAVSLDVNTEVVLRNLVAYETSVEPGPMIFTRYTELINGIIDTEEDVKLLRQSGIIVNRMKSDEEVARLWNGMSKSVRLTKVDFIDKVIVDVNGYYNSRWSVKGRKFFRKYVFGSWQILTLLAAILLLLLTCVEAFCSVYSCSARWSGLVKSNGQ